MPIYHPTLKERIHTFTPVQQLLMVCNELNRAAKWENDPAERKMALYRALEILDFSRNDNNLLSRSYEYHRAREVLAGYTIDSKLSSDKIRRLLKTLIKLSPQAFTMMNPRPPQP